MGLRSNNEIRESMNSGVEAFDILGYKGGLEGSYGDLFRMELGNFLIWLAASDGVIKWSEAYFISDCLEQDLAPTSVVAYMRKSDICWDEFAQQVPLSFDMSVQIDNQLFEQGQDSTVSDTLFNLYLEFGSMIATADGDIDEQEQINYDAYLTMLNSYLDDHLLCRGAAAPDPGADRIAELNKKASVNAPKKS